MSGILTVMRQVVEAEIAGQRSTLLGEVTAIYPHTKEDDDNNFEADVRLKHEHLELPKVPIAVPHIGSAATLRVGDLVLVQFVNGDLNYPVITGRFYHADDRPPLHDEDEILFEHRVADGTLNQLRFAKDGSIFLQRDVTKPEDNSEAKATIKIDGSSGDIQLTAGEKIVILLKNDSEIQITADGKPLKLKCSKMTVEGDVEVKGEFKAVSGANSTTIKGNEITGA